MRWLLCLTICIAPFFNYLFVGAAATRRSGECVPTSTDLQSYHCFSGTRAVVCEDEEPECEEWASTNECKNNPGFMLLHCRKSCATCLDGHSGTLQTSPLVSADAVVSRLEETVEYLKRQDPDRSTCKNLDAQCTLRAVQGECETSQWMQLNCAPACKTCHLVATA